MTASSGGHFETAADINGNEIDVMVDTGATLVALTYEDAERAGLHLKSSDFTQGVRTANGTGKVAPVTLSSISIGDITVRNVKGAVAEPGKLHKTLLGMSFSGASPASKCALTPSCCTNKSLIYATIQAFKASPSP